MGARFTNLVTAAARRFYGVLRCCGDKTRDWLLWVQRDCNGAFSGWADFSALLATVTHRRIFGFRSDFKLRGDREFGRSRNARPTIMGWLWMRCPLCADCVEKVSELAIGPCV